MDKMEFARACMSFFDKWTDICEAVGGRPMDYVESFWLFIVVVPIITVLVISAMQACWKIKKFRIAFGMTLFLAVWPAIVTGGIIYFALSKVYAFKKISLRRALHKGTDTYIRFFERGTFVRKK